MCHWLLWWSLASSVVHAQVSTLTVSSDQKLSAPRWMFDRQAPIKQNKLIAILVRARRAELEKNSAACVAALAQARPLGKSLEQWIDLAELRCALIPDKKDKYSAVLLSKASAKIQNHFKWLTKLSTVSMVRSLYTRALLQLGEVQLKGNRRAAWATIDKLEQLKESLNAEDRARLYRMAGELAFLEQNLLAAQDFISRSLLERDSPELRAKLDAIRTTLIGKKEEKSIVEQGVQVAAPPDLGISPQEQGYYERMINGIQSQDYISAVEDGMNLITKFPGGVRAQEATDRVLEIYLSIAANSHEKFRHLLGRVVRQMTSADAGRLLKWAQAAYNRTNYLNALEFSERAYEKFVGHPDSTRALLLAGKAAIAAGEYGTASENLERLTNKAAGSRESIEAMFRLGLLRFRANKLSEAVAYFERVLALNPDGDFEYRALYWEWRALQRLKNDRAKEYSARLLSKYPVTYYGLRAHAEQNGGKIEFASLKKPIKVEMRLLTSERTAWEKFLVLIEAGWYEEAQSELQNLPEPQSFPERLLRSRLWALAFRYDRAIGLANRAWEKAPELVHTDTLRWVYPKEYESYVKTSSDKAKLSPLWIYSLMRQESSFQKDAKSSANALGLMQLLPGTAQQMADAQKLKIKVPDSLYQPDVNIQLGSTYFARMIASFNGNVPLALAAYNAGPTRLRRWLASRKDLEGLEGKVSSAPDVEIWMDELPWDETSFYVKAILRNWIVYKFLDQGQFQVADPVWKS